MVSYLNSIIKSINYIETHLCENIDLVEVANEAGYSQYHFQRVFSGLVGDSLKDYIRKRRVTEAAKTLVNSKQPIIEIALKYGFKSRESFSRSFSKVYGRSPSQVRKQGLLYFIREPMTLEYLTFEYNRRLHGMKPKFKTIKKKTIVGEKYPVALDGTNYQEIPLIWHNYLLNNKCCLKNNDIYGVCIIKNKSFYYLIGHEVLSNSDAQSDKSKYIIDNINYAVFTTIGPVTETVQKTWDYIYGIWLPNSQYRHTGEADMEFYYNVLDKQYADLFVPICKK